VIWKEIFYPELMPAEWSHAGSNKALFTDLECSECGYTLFPPTYPETCPQCGGEKE
jgi:rubrerythrin